MALENVSFFLEKGKKLGIVGESGSGKSTLTKILTGFLPYNDGKVQLENRVIQARVKDRKWIGKKMQLVFQTSLSSLNPRQTVQQILEEPLINFFSLSTEERKQKIVAILKEVNLQISVLEKKSISLSGGQAQRVCIARALLANPEILICDEPVTSLDMTTQIKIIQLLQKIVKEQQLSLIFISHDISLVQELCDEILVLREGKIIDRFAANDWKNAERHSYTKELIESTEILIQRGETGSALL
ncbi:dipeptide/oligopeptide/nickel ABC transporter ATP-binding protein [Lederbergia sp. NSJ-179]|uniref:ABC transporter ATP-binding protein n=1 Tax=Lederbergia sp. NSJ-179 TaxID=2931402 RepID=UPI001FD16591|nr:dipeptide/oligopeptide/nickel ABC transporter ATP-binding protein [Lederbergia sp. NSJ-179]MCJ7840873.1 dipeptide/oligopeptide/nickel ABC transporter ATP-binding protein [Lederbergia sp. NSJ-179]